MPNALEWPYANKVPTKMILTIMNKKNLLFITSAFTYACLPVISAKMLWRPFHWLSSLFAFEPPLLAAVFHYGQRAGLVLYASFLNQFRRYDLRFAEYGKYLRSPGLTADFAFILYRIAFKSDALWKMSSCWFAYAQNLLIKRGGHRMGMLAEAWCQ